MPVVVPKTRREPAFGVKSGELGADSVLTQPSHKTTRVDSTESTGSRPIQP